MADLYYRYGMGKSAELCITAYNYREQNGKVVIFNGKNDEKIVSAVTGKKDVLTTDVTDYLDNDLLFEKGNFYQKEAISAILVDNAHLLSKEEAEQLYLITKFYNIPVLAYGNRIETPGALRFMELANRIEAVDGIPNQAKKAQLHFYYGAMNCGKTTKLYCRAQYLEQIGQKIKLIYNANAEQQGLAAMYALLNRRLASDVA